MKELTYKQWSRVMLENQDLSLETKSWQIVKSSIIYKNQFLNVTENIVNNSNQNNALYYVVNRKGFFAVSVPLEKDLNTIYLVGQYRLAVNRFSYEFPMGYVPNVKPLKMSQVELKEETGLQAKKWHKLAEFNIAHGFSGQKAYAHLATDLIYGYSAREEGEIMLMKKVTLLELEKMIDQGQIFDGVTITVFYFLKKFLAQAGL